jgi:hypothetical protein
MKRLLLPTILLLFSISFHGMYNSRKKIILRTIHNKFWSKKYKKPTHGDAIYSDLGKAIIEKKIDDFKRILQGEPDLKIVRSYYHDRNNSWKDDEGWEGFPDGWGFPKDSAVDLIREQILYYRGMMHLVIESAIRQKDIKTIEEAYQKFIDYDDEFIELAKKIGDSTIIKAVATWKLFHSIEESNISGVREALLAGADINAFKNGYSTLGWAMKSKDPDIAIVQTLLDQRLKIGRIFIVQWWTGLTESIKDYFLDYIEDGIDTANKNYKYNEESLKIWRIDLHYNIRRWIKTDMTFNEIALRMKQERPHTRALELGCVNQILSEPY